MKRKRLILPVILTAALLVGCRLSAGPEKNVWVEENGITCYRDAEGNLATGWQTIDGQQYYFAEDHSITTGWLDLDGSRYYFHNNGTLAQNWQTIDGKTYYFTAQGAVSGWQTIDNQRYYFLSDCTLATGLTVIEDVPYLLGSDGKPRAGIAYWNGTAHFFSDEGIRTSGWQEYAGQTYYANQDGTLYTGWLEEGEYRYYFLSDGAMAVGKQEIDGRTYYFSPHGVEIILVNPWNYMPEDYVTEQVPIDNAYTIDAGCHEPLMRMLADCKAAGHSPLVVSGYRSQEIQEWLFQRKVNYYIEEENITDLEEARRLAGMTIAIPGTSEHQLGLAVDIASTEYRNLDEGQVNTATQQWLMEHCWEYGFILRYPLDSTDITGIIYEPWHYRYVGVEIALELRDLGITLEEYLGAA